MQIIIQVLYIDHCFSYLVNKDIFDAFFSPTVFEYIVDLLSDNRIEIHIKCPIINEHECIENSCA